MSRRKEKEKEKAKDTHPASPGVSRGGAEESIWAKSDEVNQKDQREYTIVIGRPGVFKLLLKRTEKMSLGMKRPVCVIKLVKGQDAKSGTVLSTHNRIGDSSTGDIIHVFAINEVPCTIYLRVWAVVPGGMSKMPFAANLFVLLDKNPNMFVPPKQSSGSGLLERSNSGSNRGKNNTIMEGAPTLTMTEQADFVIGYVCAWLEKRAISVAAMYRRTPAEGKTELLKSHFAAGNEVDLDGVEEQSIVAHAFKRWLANNPPLLSYEFYNSFIAANATTDPNGRAAAVSRVLDNLNSQSRASVMRIVLLLRAVEVQSKNPVDVAYLVSLFAPCLLRRFGDPIPSQPEGSGVAYSLLKFLLANCTQIFNTTSAQRDEQTKMIAPEEKVVIERNLRESKMVIALTSADRIQRDRTATAMEIAGQLSDAQPGYPSNYTGTGTPFSNMPSPLTASSNYSIMLALSPTPAPPPSGTVLTLVAPTQSPSVRSPSPSAQPKSPRPGQVPGGTYTTLPSFPAPARPPLDTEPPLAPTMLRNQSPTKSPVPVAQPPQQPAPQSFAMLGRNSEGGVDINFEQLLGQRQLTVQQLAQMLVDGKIEEVDLYLLAMPEQEANETLKLVREELSLRLAQLNGP